MPHALLAPSAADRWMTCPGSVSWADPVPDDPSEYSAEGTVAHAIRSECLSLGFEPIDFLGSKIKADGYTFECTREMVDHLNPGIDRVREDIGPDGKMWVEHRLSMSKWIPVPRPEGGFGTLDVGIVRPDIIIIDDLKYGAGVPVYPAENRQLRLYAIAFWWNIARHLTSATEFLIRIDQPRIANAGGEWRTNLTDLLAFAENEVLPAALRTEEPNAPLVASEKGCRFCSRRRTCVEFARFNLDLFAMKFEDMAGEEPILPDIRELTPERKGYILRHRAMFSKWIELLHAEMLDDALAGRPTPGHKAVYGRRPSRTWTDKKKAGAVLETFLNKDQVYETVTISPAAAEKAIGKKRFGGSAELTKLIAQGQAKPILVLEEEDGIPVESYADKFEAMAQDEDPLL